MPPAAGTSAVFFGLASPTSRSAGKYYSKILPIHCSTAQLHHQRDCRPSCTGKHKGRGCQRERSCSLSAYGHAFRVGLCSRKEEGSCAKKNAEELHLDVARNDKRSLADVRMGAEALYTAQACVPSSSQPGQYQSDFAGRSSPRKAPPICTVYCLGKNT